MSAARQASKSTAVPERIRDLAAAIREEVLELPGVVESGRSFRIAKRIFVRSSAQPSRVFLEFKLPLDQAKLATKLPFVKPMQFGGMGKHGWVEVALSRKSELPAVLMLVRASHGLYV